MGRYSDPTAALAMGSVNREFAKYEKKAKKLRSLYKAGKLSEDALEKAYAEFPTLYRHVFDRVFWEDTYLWEDETPPAQAQ